MLDCERLREYDFDTFAYSKEQLVRMAAQAIEASNREAGVVNVWKLHDLIKEIALNYNIIPYHNFSHGFTVFQVITPNRSTEG